MTTLIYKDEVYTLSGAAMEVYNVLEPGFLEPIYQEALAMEFADRLVPFQAQSCAFPTRDAI